MSHSHITCSNIENGYKCMQSNCPAERKHGNPSDPARPFFLLVWKKVRKRKNKTINGNISTDASMWI